MSPDRRVERQVVGGGGVVVVVVVVVVVPVDVCVGV